MDGCTEFYFQHLEICDSGTILEVPGTGTSLALLAARKQRWDRAQQEITNLVSHQYLQAAHTNLRLTQAPYAPTWRRLEIIVDGRSIQARYDGQPLINGAPSAVTTIATSHLPPGGNNLKGSIGLYLDSTSVSVRNFTIETY